MGYTVQGKNKMLDELGAVIKYVGLLDEGEIELSGGNPAYARQSITWGAAANGEISATNQPVFNVPAGASVKYVVFMSDATGGIEYGRAEVVKETFGNQGTYTIISVTLDLNADVEEE